MANLKEISIGLLSSTASVNLNAAADTETELYTVPTGNSVIVTHFVIHTLSASAASAVVTFGKTGGSCDGILGNQTLSNLNATTKAAIIQPVPNATPVIQTFLTETQVVGVEITTAAGSACTCTIDTFGYLF